MSKDMTITIKNEYIKRANPFMLSYMRGTEYLDNKQSGFKGNQYNKVTAKPAESTSQIIAEN